MRGKDGAQERKGLQGSTHTLVLHSDRLEQSCLHAGEKLSNPSLATAPVKEKKPHGVVCSGPHG